MCAFMQQIPPTQKKKNSFFSGAGNVLYITNYVICTVTQPFFFFLLMHDSDRHRFFDHPAPKPLRSSACLPATLSLVPHIHMQIGTQKKKNGHRPPRALQSSSFNQTMNQNLPKNMYICIT